MRHRENGNGETEKVRRVPGVLEIIIDQSVDFFESFLVQARHPPGLDNIRCTVESSCPVAR